ncbi:MAG: HAMP domain-containing histidine kinase [Eubacterium sp.]|nr:HAMP domain-containing histidine kinase [Eubacterium sp.]
MIKNLRRKFILISMLSMLLVLAVIMGIANTINYRKIVSQADRLTTILAENDGAFGEPFKMPQKSETMENQQEQGERKHPMEFSPETPFSTRFFFVKFDDNGTVQECDVSKIAAVDEEQAKSLGQEILKKENGVGFSDVYRYRVADTDEGKIVIFVDCTQSLDHIKNFAKVSAMVSFLGLGAVFVLVLFFSKLVFKPVQETYEKQKRFITDASHELKTPLTIIDANTEVIEMESGETKWTKSTRKQVKRLSGLTEQMLALSRLDETKKVEQKESFCISDVISESAEPFEAMATMSGKEFRMEIEEGLTYCGDSKGISRLIGILLDNALKYSDEKGWISLKVFFTGKKIHVSVENSVEQIPKGNLNILFERFYRLDASRNSKTGGSGIGLAVAKAIVESHKGKINAKSADGKSLFVEIEL